MPSKVGTLFVELLYVKVEISFDEEHATVCNSADLGIILLVFVHCGRIEHTV
jgi:hypothetical protein